MQEFIQKFVAEAQNVGRGIKKLRFFQFIDLQRFFQVLSPREKALLAGLIVLVFADLFFMASKAYFRATTEVAANGGSYSEGLVGEPRFINPLLAQSQTDKDIVRLVYAGLYKYDNKGNMVPDLAESMPQISANQKEYIVRLKNNLKWQDSRPITADDVVFTIKTLKDPNYRSPIGRFWQNISVEKIDGLSVKIINANLSSPFLANLTLGIIPEHVWSKISPEDFAFSKYNMEPIGSGPYFLKEVNKSADGSILSMVFGSYSSFWAGRPHLDEITLKFYENYEEGIFALHSKDVQGFGFMPFNNKIYIDQKKTNLDIYQTTVNEYQALYFNLYRSKVISDINVRKALATAVNRNDLIEKVYFGLAKPAYGPIMKGQLGYYEAIEKINAYNLDEANKILEQAGWTMGNDGIRSKGSQRLQFSITTNDFVSNQKSAEYLRDEWRKIGANVILNIVPTHELENDYIRPRNFETMLFAESIGFDPDPFVFWHSSQAQNPGFNISQYKSTAADKFISDARNTFDNKIRTEKYEQLQVLMSNDIPAIFLAQSAFVYEFRNKLKGLDMPQLANPEDRFYDVSNWYIKTGRSFKK